MDDFIISNQILSTIEKENSFNQAYAVFAKYAAVGYDVTGDYYFLPQQLIATNITFDRLFLLNRIVEHSSFTCDRNRYPERFLEVLAASTY